MENYFKTDFSSEATKSEQNEIEKLDECEFSKPEVINQVSQLVNWVNTYAVYQSQGDPSTKTFMDGFSLVQGLEAELKNCQQLNLTRVTQASNVATEKKLLQLENEKLRQQLKEQSVQVEKLQKRNTKLENHEKKIEIREAMPLGKLKCKVANLQLIFDTLVGKLEKEPSNQDDTLSVQRKQELGELRRDVGDLFSRVKHDMIKWEKNQKEMAGKLERTRVGLNSLHETVMPTPQQDIPFAVPSTSQAALRNMPKYQNDMLEASTSNNTSSVIQSIGNGNFGNSFEASGNDSKPKRKQILAGSSVKTALSKHIKSRSVRKSKENILQKSNQVLQSTTSSSTATITSDSVSGTESIIEPGAAGAAAKNTDENISVPQKPKSPIICGLCGSGFSTLLQLKLHHAVFHGESTGPPVRVEFPQDPMQLQQNRSQNLAELTREVDLVQYFSVGQVNPLLSAFGAADLEQFLVQYLMELAGGITLPLAGNSSSSSGDGSEKN